MVLAPVLQLDITGASGASGRTGARAPVRPMPTG